MRNLKTSDITTAIGMPIKGGTLDHLQLAYKEAIAEAAKGFIGPGYNPAIMYIMNGLNNSGSGSNYNISAGSVFYNGEIYLVDAAVFTAGGSLTAIAVLDTTYFTGTAADGVEFTDGVVRNVHEIRKIKLQAGNTGSGLANYFDFQRVNANIPQLNLSGGGIATIGGVYPNLSVNVPAPPSPGSIVLGHGYIPIGDINSTADLDGNTALLSGGGNGMAGYLYTYPTPPGTSNYYACLMVHNPGITTMGEAGVNNSCSVQLGQITSTQMRFFISTPFSTNAQDLWIRYVLFALP